MLHQCGSDRVLYLGKLVPSSPTVVMLLCEEVQGKCAHFSLSGCVSSDWTFSLVL